MNQDLMEYFQEIIYQKKIKDGAYVINPGEYADIVRIGLLHFVAKMKLFILIALVLSIFRKKLKEFIGNKSIKANIFRIQANISVMRGYFCIGFLDFTVAGKKID